MYFWCGKKILARSEEDIGSGFRLSVKSSTGLDFTPYSSLLYCDWNWLKLYKKGKQPFNKVLKLKKINLLKHQ